MKTTTFHSIVWKEASLYVARCLEINVASQGESHDEAVKNLKEALDLYLEDHQDAVPEIKEVEVEEVTV
ncbi:MAG: type II toxin-antitoxin system HicB family antitoxin [Candidatus Woykebacteria bacterium]